jgi:hypothetical protein
MMSAIFLVYGCILCEFAVVQYPTSGLLEGWRICSYVQGIFAFLARGEGSPDKPTK